MNKERFLAIYFLIFTVVLLAVVLVYPGNNWDIVGYLAAAKSFDIKNKVELHDFVYNELHQAVSEEDYPFYIDSPYKKVVSEDPESLNQVRIFYQIRPAFIVPIYLLSKIGVNIFYAAHLATALPVFLGLWIFYLAAHKGIDSYLILILPIFALALGAFVVARSSSPDGLAFLIVAIIFYLLLKDHWAVLLVLSLSLLVRTDLLVFVLLILGYLFVTHSRWRIGIVIALFLCLAFYSGINHFYGNYGYATLFWNTFIERLPYPAEASITLDWANYRHAFTQGLLSIYFFSKSLLVYIVLLALTILLYLKMRSQKTFDEQNLRAPLTIAILAFISVVIHFLLFPSILTRYFSGQYFLCSVVFLMILTAAINSDNNSLSATE